jgi:hypothetical protein
MMLGEDSPDGEAASSHDAVCATSEVSWPALADEGEEEEPEINWDSAAAGSKGKLKVNALQAFTPVGLKVLVVDDNRVCLAILEKMLNRCKYTGEYVLSSSQKLSGLIFFSEIHQLLLKAISSYALVCRGRAFLGFGVQLARCYWQIN